MSKTDAVARITQTNMHANERDARARRFLLRMFRVNLKLARDTCLPVRLSYPGNAKSNHRWANSPLHDICHRADSKSLRFQSLVSLSLPRESRQWFFARRRCRVLTRWYVRYNEISVRLLTFIWSIISQRHTRQIDRLILTRMPRRIEVKTSKNSRNSIVNCLTLALFVTTAWRIEACEKLFYL